MDRAGVKSAVIVLSVAALVVCGVSALAIGFAFGMSKNNQTINSTNSSSNHFYKSAYKKFSSYAVVSDTDVCSRIGKSILDKQGSAVDAAIATTLCVGVVNLHSCGVGGGHMAIIYDTPRNETKKVLTTMLARERAPLNSTQGMFKNASSVRGMLSSAVPGEIKGFYEAWKRFGKLEWSELVDPTVNLLENGFIIERALGQAILDYKDLIMTYPGIKKMYTKSDGSLLKTGDLYRDPQLAKTFRNISADPMGFYDGPLAREIAREVQEEGGIITEEDLKAYESEWKNSTEVHLQGTQLKHHSLRPPSSGAVLGLILNIMAGYKLNPDSFSESNLSLTYHRLIEASKFAFAGRSRLGDERFDNVSELVQNMTSTEFAEFIRLKINDLTTFNDISHYGDVYDEARDHGTAHVDIYGADGSAVSITSTINNSFGSGIRGRVTGILYNNEMDLFSGPNKSSGYEPYPSNFLEPFKIPMSSMSPSLIMDQNGRVKIATGGSGGSKIITSTAAVVLNSIFANETLDVSVDRPRVHHQLSPNNVAYDDWLEQKYINDLEKKGHVMIANALTAVCGTIKVNCDVTGVGACIEAVSDGRKGGQPDGV